MTTPRRAVLQRQHAGRRPALARADIVAAALRVADAEGLDAVSIRRVASELCARTMSLYTYIAGKDDLLSLMMEEITGEALLPELPAGWRAALTAIAHQERAVFERHPWLGDLIGRTPRAGVNGLRHVEQSLAAVADLGLDPAHAWQVLVALDDFVIGATLREAALRREVPPPADPAAHDELAPYLRQASDPAEFPHLSRLVAAGVPHKVVDFDAGLSLVLDGIAARYGD